jgi:hypothetical protein
MKTLTVAQLLAAAQKKRALRTKDWLERARLVVAAARDRAVETALSVFPSPALGECRHCGLARRLVGSARAYVGFVRANNVAEYDVTEVCHRSRGRPVIRCPILA